MFGSKRTQHKRVDKISTELSAGVEHLRSAAATAAEVAGDRIGPQVAGARLAVAPKVEAAQKAAIATLGPRVEAARDVLTPRVDAARDAIQPAWDSAIAALAPMVASAVERAAEQGRKAEKSTRKQRKEARKRTEYATMALRGRKPVRRWPWAVVALAIGVAAGAAGGLLARRNSEAEWEEFDEFEAAAEDPIPAGRGAASPAVVGLSTAGPDTSTVDDLSGRNADDQALTEPEGLADPAGIDSGTGRGTKKATVGGDRKSKDEAPTQTMPVVED